MDEKGTEGAGGSGVQTLPMETPIRVKINRRFLLMIWETKMNNLLFFGKIVNPSAKQEMQDMQFRSLGRGDPLEREMATYSSIPAGNVHGQRSLAGFSPWGHKKSDMTERVHTHLCV